MDRRRHSAISAAAGLVLAANLAAAADSPVPLTDTIAALDDAVFDAFNRCSDPAQLERHAAFFDPAVEFYHDTGGVTWTREAMLANTANHVCGRFRRERVAGSLRVFPIHDFGAIAQGTHRFCALDRAGCDGEADFTIVWRRDADGWRITRVLSYGHRAATGPDASP